MQHLLPLRVYWLYYEVKVVEGTLNNREFTLGNIKVYPNPVTDRVIIDAGTDTTLRSVAMVDVNGRIVFNTEAPGSVSEINVAGIASGVYLIKITTDNGSMIKKIIKQ